MEQTTLVEILMWGLGLCAGGFVFLAGWCWILYGRTSKNEIELQKRVSYEWLESNFMKDCKERHAMEEKKVSKQLREIKVCITEVKDALCGTLEKKGFITILNEVDGRVTNIEEKIEKMENRSE